MRSLERFLVYIAAVFAMLAWLTAWRTPGGRRLALLTTSSRGSDWPQPSGN